MKKFILGATSIAALSQPAHSFFDLFGGGFFGLEKISEAIFGGGQTRNNIEYNDRSYYGSKNNQIYYDSYRNEMLNEKDIKEDRYVIPHKPNNREENEKVLFEFDRKFNNNIFF